MERQERVVEGNIIAALCIHVERHYETRYFVKLTKFQKGLVSK
jgi:hypothetical protein